MDSERQRKKRGVIFPSCSFRIKTFRYGYDRLLQHMEPYMLFLKSLQVQCLWPLSLLVVRGFSDLTFSTKWPPSAL